MLVVLRKAMCRWLELLLLVALQDSVADMLIKKWVEVFLLLTTLRYSRAVLSHL